MKKIILIFSCCVTLTTIYAQQKNAIPSAFLTVESDGSKSEAVIKDSSPTGNAAIELFNDIESEFSLGILGSSTGANSQAFLWNNVNASMVFGTNNQERMRIRGDGNVGVGSNNPLAKLDVRGDIRISNANIPMGLTTEVGGNTPLLNFDVNFRQLFKLDQFRGASFRIDSRDGAPLFQWIKRSAGSTVESTLMVLTESGNVGIGTDAPTNKLHVVGDVNFINHNASQFWSARSDSDYDIIQDNASTSRAFTVHAGASGSDVLSAWSSLGPSLYYPALIVKNGTGYLGLGTTTPGSELHIKQKASGSNNGVRIEDVDGTHWNTYVDGADDYNFAYNGSLRAYIQDGSGAFINTSDKKLKTNITPLESVLSRVLQLKPKWYNYIDNKPGMPKTLGFIAQEVEEYFPNLIHHKGEIKGLAYDDFGVLAIKAIQEQQQIIEEKESHIAELEKEVTDVNSRLTALEAKLAALDHLQQKVSDLEMDYQKCCSEHSTLLGQPTKDEAILSEGPAYLTQNAPNPFHTETTIQYHLPATTKSAQLHITDLNGKLLKTIPLQGAGAGSVTIEAGQLSAGTFFYTLVVDGVVVDTKKMLLTK